MGGGAHFGQTGESCSLVEGKGGREYCMLLM